MFSFVDNIPQMTDTSESTTVTTKDPRNSRIGTPLYSTCLFSDQVDVTEEEERGRMTLVVACRRGTRTLL